MLPHSVLQLLMTPFLSVLLRLRDLLKLLPPPIVPGVWESYPRHWRAQIPKRMMLRRWNVQDTDRGEALYTFPGRNFGARLMQVVRIDAGHHAFLHRPPAWSRFELCVLSGILLFTLGTAVVVYGMFEGVLPSHPVNGLKTALTAAILIAVMCACLYDRRAKKRYEWRVAGNELLVRLGYTGGVDGYVTIPTRPDMPLFLPEDRATHCAFAPRS